MEVLLWQLGKELGWPAGAWKTMAEAPRGHRKYRRAVSFPCRPSAAVEQTAGEAGGKLLLNGGVSAESLEAEDGEDGGQRTGRGPRHRRRGPIHLLSLPLRGLRALGRIRGRKS
eukprot:215147-Hanusia_phi.AAC.2